MVSRNKIVTTVIILLLLLVLFSGCIGEKKANPAPESINKEAADVSLSNLAQSSTEENIPEISIISFSSIYLHDNNEDIYLFSWENVPGNESNGLLDYLRHQFHVSWAENVQITRDDVNKTIRVFDARGSIAIKRMDDKRVYLEISPRILFSWDDVPGNDTVRFAEFLAWNFGFDWAVKAKIEKTDDGRIIKVWNETDHLSLELNDEKTVVRVRTDGIMSYLPYVRLEDGKVNIYSDSNTIQHELPAKEENGRLNIYQSSPGKKHETFKRYYAAYNLSIKNNGSSPMHFKLDSLSLHDGDRIFNTTALEPHSSSIEVLLDLANENKLQDTILPPGQSLNGIVAFRVNSLYNRSFLLKYDTMTVTSASFEKSIEALEAAEYFNYSIALGTPPYNLLTDSNEMILFSWDEIPGNDSQRLIEYLRYEFGIDGETAGIDKIDDGKTIIVADRNNRISIRYNDEKNRVNLKKDDGRAFELNASTENGKLNIYGRTRGSYEPIFDDTDTWANWVNRSIFETFQKSDVERTLKSPPDNIASTEMVYALKVFPERNLTMSPVRKRFDTLLVADDTGEEIIKTDRIDGMAVRSNQTYTFKPDWMLNFPGMNFSNASVVQISFSGLYISPLCCVPGRWSINDQDVILDDRLNIIVVRNHHMGLVN